MRGRRRAKAQILRHPASPYRCWQIVNEGDGTFTGYLRCRAGPTNTRTERGAEWLVRLAIEHCEDYRGVPVLPGTVLRRKATS